MLGYKRILTFLIFLFFLADNFLSLANDIQQHRLMKHEPIRINSDLELSSIAKKEGWKGNGSAQNPYIIEGYVIEGLYYGYCIYIGNTTLHVIIKNCYLYGARGYIHFPYFSSSALHIYNARNCSIESTEIYSNGYDGIFLWSSDNISIKNCKIHSNFWAGIDIRFSKNISVYGCSVFHNANYGVYPHSSRKILLENCQIYDDYRDEIHVTLSHRVEINNCTIKSQKEYQGIYIDASSDIVVNRAYIQGCDKAIYIQSSDEINISECAMKNNWHGILLENSANITVMESIAEKCGEAGFEIVDSHIVKFANLESLRNLYGISISNSEEISVENLTVEYSKIDGVSVEYSENCTLKNLYVNDTNRCGAIIDHSTHIHIFNMNAMNFLYGIYLYYSDFNEIINSSILYGSYGILLEHSSNNKMSECAVGNNNQGIYLLYSWGNEISQNRVYGDYIADLYLQNSNGNSVTGNTFENGIFINESRNNIVEDNYVQGLPLIYLENVRNEKITGKEGEIILVNCSEIYIGNVISRNLLVGIELIFCKNVTIKNCILAKNHYGIYLQKSSRNVVVSNTLNENFCGIYVDEYSSGNKIYHNRFINNTVQAHDDGENYWNESYPVGGNYWSDYSGNDYKWGENQDLSFADGIGDLPYDKIDGKSHAVDNYPFVYHNIPEKGADYPSSQFMGMVALIIGFSILLALLSFRRFLRRLN